MKERMKAILGSPITGLILGMVMGTIAYVIFSMPYPF